MFWGPVGRESRGIPRAGPAPNALLAYTEAKRPGVRRRGVSRGVGLVRSLRDLPTSGWRDVPTYGAPGGSNGVVPHLKKETCRLIGAGTTAEPVCCSPVSVRTQHPGGKVTLRVEAPRTTAGATSTSGPSKYSWSIWSTPGMPGYSSHSGRVIGMPMAFASRQSRRM